MNESPVSLRSRQPLGAPSAELLAGLAAVAGITDAVLGDEPEQVLDLVVRQARRLISATTACIEAVHPPDRLLVQAVDADGTHTGGQTRLLDTAAPQREAVATGRAVIIAEQDRSADPAAPTERPVGSVLVVPLPPAHRPLGTLTIEALPGRHPFTPLDLELAALLAGHASVALELSRVRQDGQPPVAVDLDSVTQRLHDVVMQRLFATGLQLQGVARTVPGPVADTLTAAAQALDQTMEDLRAAIHALRRVGTGPGPDLRAALIEAAAEADRAGR